MCYGKLACLFVKVCCLCVMETPVALIWVAAFVLWKSELLI